MTENWKAFATVDPFDGMDAKAPGRVENLVAGKWSAPSAVRDDIPDPLNGGTFLSVPDTVDIGPFLDGTA